MTHAIIFFLLAIGMTISAAIQGGWCILWAWPAFSFGFVGAAYAGLGPKIFGKQPNGQLLWWRMAILLPFLMFAWAVWHIARFFSREPAYHEVAPGLWLGRRLLPRELPVQVTTVVDLTCEFPEPQKIVRTAQYICLPTLDATASNREDVLGLLKTLKDLPGIIFVHCASGHGRSALIAAALLMTRSKAMNAKEALTLIKTVRPGIHLQPSQYRLLESLQKMPEQQEP